MKPSSASPQYKKKQESPYKIQSARQYELSYNTTISEDETQINIILNEMHEKLQEKYQIIKNTELERNALIEDTMRLKQRMNFLDLSLNKKKQMLMVYEKIINDADIAQEKISKSIYSLSTVIQKENQNMDKQIQQLNISF